MPSYANYKGFVWRWVMWNKTIENEEKQGLQAFKMSWNYCAILTYLNCQWTSLYSYNIFTTIFRHKTLLASQERVIVMDFQVCPNEGHRLLSFDHCSLTTSRSWKGRYSHHNQYPFREFSPKYPCQYRCSENSSFESKIVQIPYYFERDFSGKILAIPPLFQIFLLWNQAFKRLDTGSSGRERVD